MKKEKTEFKKYKISPLTEHAPAEYYNSEDKAIHRGYIIANSLDCCVNMYVWEKQSGWKLLPCIEPDAWEYE